MPAAPRVPRRYRVLASLVPLLLLMVAVSTALIVKWRGEFARLAREKRQRSAALPALESARRALERIELMARRSDTGFDDLRDMANLAVETASVAIELDPAGEEGYRVRGRALEMTYNFDEARADYEKALELHPESPARLHLGLLVVRQIARARLAGMKTSLERPEDMRDRAVLPLRRFQAPPPEWRLEVEEAARYLAGAAVPYALGEYADVAAQAATALEFDSTAWPAAYLRGMAALELGKAEDAARDLERATRIAPGVADPHAWLGLALHRLKRTGEGIDALTTALQASPHFLEAYFVRGTLRFEAELFDAARADFEACARLRSLPEIHLKLGIAGFESWQRGGRADARVLEGAVQALGAYLQARPGDPAARILRARARLGRGDAAGAEEDLVQALAASPGAIEAHEVRAEAREAQGLWVEAEAEHTAVLEKAQDAKRAAAAQRRRARARARASKIDEALADYDALLARDPADSGLAVERAELLLGAGRLEDAMAATARALENNPRDALVKSLRSRVLLKKGDPEGAIREATEALAIDPQQAAALVARGEAYLKAGRKAEAAADWARAIELRPDLKPQLAPRIPE